MKVLFGQHGLTFWEHVWTNTTKREAVDRLERMQRDRDLILCPSEKLKTQLRQYRERITRNGDLVYGGSSPTDDYVQVLMTGVMADEQNRLQKVLEPVQEPAPGTSEWHRENEARIERVYQERNRQEQAEKDWDL